MTKLICTLCPKGCHIECREGVFSGYSCEKGLGYAKAELANPVRTLTSTVRILGARYDRAPVKSDHPLPKARLLEAARALYGVVLSAPVKEGDIALKNILGLGTDIVVTRTMEEAKGGRHP